ncbi:MAG: O-antigen ligase domain-containing protein [Cyanobacteria bacterium P01_A01_bin.135]
MSLLLVAGLGTPAAIAFPVGSLALGLFLYYRAPYLYIGYAWWMVFLGNLIRRLIDYRAGYLTFGPWGLTTNLVACISLITAVTYLPSSHRKGLLTFVIPLCSVGYAFCIGFNQNALNGVVNGTLAWVCPVAFGLHIFLHWRDYPQLKQVFLKTFLWGVLVMGIYGVIQYVFAPPWEVFWLDNTQIASFGSPEPFGIRVASTAGAPQTFATLMLSGLILVFCEATNPVSYLASGFGYISFILTFARAVWLSAAISIPLFLLSLKPSYQIRMIIVGVVLFVIVATTLLSWEPVYEKFYERFESFFDLRNDQSFNDRSAGYEVLWGAALVEFLGRGIGFSTTDISASIGANDGSIFPLIFNFGWFGLLGYLGGFLVMLLKLLSIPDARSDIFIGACRMVVLCVLVQAGLNSIFDSSSGMVMWGFMAMGLAGHKYYLAQRSAKEVSGAKAQIQPYPSPIQ